MRRNEIGGKKKAVQFIFEEAGERGEEEDTGAGYTGKDETYMVQTGRGGVCPPKKRLSKMDDTRRIG